MIASICCRPKPWLLFLVAIWIFSCKPVCQALPIPSPQATQRTDTSTVQQTPPSTGKQQEPLPRPGESVGGGGGFSVDLTGLFGHKEPDIEKTLDKKGPQFPDAFTMSSFGVQGYVKGNWPVVLEYEVEEPALILVTIAAPGVETASYRLDSTKQRHLTIFHIPARFGAKPVPGWYLIRALSDNVGELKPVHFHIFALGAGEKAVGSVTIDQLIFQQQLLNTQQKQKVGYSFHSLSDFDEVEVAFPKGSMLLPDRLIIQEKVKVESISGGVERDAVVQRTWDGKADNGKFSPGTHYMVVRAWRGLRSGADWVTVWSTQVLRVE